jgi:hypothetical protein
MAACKFSNALNIRKLSLPVTCILQNPPSGVLVALAQLFDASGTPVTLKIAADGQSFVVPNTVAAGTWTLELRVVGGPDPLPSVRVVEDCDAAQRILTITDPVAKMARATLVVLP